MENVLRLRDYGVLSPMYFMYYTSPARAKRSLQNRGKKHIRHRKWQKPSKKHHFPGTKEVVHRNLQS